MSGDIASTDNVIDIRERLDAKKPKLINPRHRILSKSRMDKIVDRIARRKLRRARKDQS